ncbi:hypothetical protein QBC36DRAFT_83053 [Triangularia setosa]|uniref:Uncharacterized protein n=1 Tax=Triangularia setosa TaxID=2587417 RepID=A0AAN6WG53_9PEZI|nr:hypothetical protein QBC36DRAFT_83053 [Podospora setosa]
MAAQVSSSRTSELPRMPTAAGQLPRSRRGELTQLREAVAITLAFLSTSDRNEIESLIRKAKTWANRYYKGYQYSSKPSAALLDQFPHIFDLNTEGLARLQAKMTVNSTMPEPPSGDLREFRRWERKAVPTEAFPKFCEPTLASEEALDEVLNVHPRRSPRTRIKQAIQVGTAELRDTGFVDFLPEFLGQLARGSVDARIPFASTPEPAQLEARLEGATEQQDPMDVFAELRETQQRRHGRRVILPGGRPFRLPGDETEDGAIDAGSNIVVGQYQDAHDSGDETDASTSTTASLRANRKRKLNAGFAESSFQPNKIRLQYTRPAVSLCNQYKKMLAEYAQQHPGSSANDALADLEHKMPIPERSPSPELSDRENSVAQIRVIKIKIPEGWSSTESSRAGSPAAPSPPKMIVLVDPRSRSPSPTAATARPSPSPSQIIKLRNPRPRTASPADPLGRSLTPSRVTKIKAVNSRQTSPVRSPSRSATPGRATRIKVINKKASPGPQTRDASPVSPGASSPSGSTSSSNLEITRPGSSCSNTSLDSTWSTGSKVTRIKAIGKKRPPSPQHVSESVLRPSSSCSDGSGKKITFKIVKRPKVTSVGEIDMRSSKKKLFMDELDVALNGM